MFKRVSIVTFSLMLVLIFFNLATRASIARAQVQVLNLPVSTNEFCVNVSEIPQIECSALVAFYNSTHGPGSGQLQGWLDTTTPCTWFGVTCNNGTVQKLGIWDFHLVGTLPPELGNLSNLQSLRISTWLRGSIPSELGNLSNLQILDLSGNQFSGNIPSELGNLSNLQRLDLSRNQFSGNIPSELGTLSNLQTLSLEETFNGTIPPELGNLSNLQTLSLAGTFSSAIPPELGNLSNLQTLSLGGAFSGTIPSELGNLSNLQTLSLQGTFSGTIPPELGNLSNLQTLDLSLEGDNFYATIPPEFGNLSKLQIFRLQSPIGRVGTFPPNFAGITIPPELGKLSTLQTLTLVYPLHGTIPAELGRLANLQTLILQGGLSGAIPAELGNLSKLQLLRLEDNQLSGSIPSELGKLTNLSDFRLWGNRLSGAIPPQLGNLVNLSEFVLRDNLLSGSIPPELGNLTNLSRLNLARNQLSGSIPAELGNLIALERIDLSNNQLSGNIPSELSNLPKLRELNLSTNLFSGNILSGVYALTNLETLNMSANQLDGSIPSDLLTRTKLRYLDLSKNHLTGTLPPEVNKLSELNLNENQLSGTLPPDPKFHFLGLSYNQLGGRISAEYCRYFVGFFPLSKVLPDDVADSLSLSNNKLSAADSCFSNRYPYWMLTQTMPPLQVQATAISENRIHISWQPISYTANGGYYEVLHAITPAGPYTELCQTLTKTASSLVVNDLLPGTHYFTVRTFTPKHQGMIHKWHVGYEYNQQNDLTSDNSAEVVIKLNSPPQTTNQILTLVPNSTKTILLHAADADSDPLSYTIITPPQHGVLSGSVPNLTYTPFNDYQGSDSLRFLANDGKADSRVATVDLVIRATPVQATLAGLLFDDMNANGQQDVGEESIISATLTLSSTTDSEFQYIQNTTTSALGAYQFENVPAGSYRLQVAPFAGYIFQNNGEINFTVLEDKTVINPHLSSYAVRNTIYLPIISASLNRLHCTEEK